jgi:hypothetical protein
VKICGFEQDIPPVDESLRIPEGAKCQEASILSHNFYIPCGAPAVAIVRHDKDRRSYYMCAPCADHNVRNRGAARERIGRARDPERYMRAIIEREINHA